MKESEDLYNILNVSRGADENEIRKQYKKLCLTNHPDKGGDVAKFQKIQKAYEVLSDESKKNLYDTMGITEEQPQQESFNMNNMNNIFASMFGGGGGPFAGGGPFGSGGPFGGGGQPKKRQKPAPRVHEISVSLYDFYHGKFIRIQFERQRFCASCNGEGCKSYNSCNTCNGRGVVEQLIMLAPGMQAMSRSPCNPCNGSGKVAYGKCDTCNGKKMFNQEKILEIQIEPGMKADDTLVFKNECSDDNNYLEPGDVHIKFQEADETIAITRKDSSLHASCCISFTNSLLGMKYVVPNHPSHPDGLTIEIPKGVQNNEVIVVLNEGMPKRNTKFFGNFHLKVEVVIDEKEKKALADNEEVIRKLFT